MLDFRTDKAFCRESNTDTEAVNLLYRGLRSMAQDSCSTIEEVMRHNGKFVGARREQNSDTEKGSSRSTGGELQ